MVIWHRTGMVLTAVVLAAACGGEGPVGPTPTTTPTTLSGTWTGSVSESHGGPGRLRMVLEQTQFAVSGTFQLDFNDVSRSRTGTVSGNVGLPSVPDRLQLGGTAGFACLAGQSAESFMQIAWTRTGDTLKGDYAGFACIGTVTGTFDVRRE